MSVYKKMYAVLCGAVDEVLGPLERIPLAQPCVQRLLDALHQAEELYINTAAYIDPADGGQIMKIRIDHPAGAENDG